jgi:hypothetical protein
MTETVGYLGHGYSYRDIGICDQCGGVVRVFSGPWWGVVPPVPSCARCRAVPKTDLPVIKMTGGRHPKHQVFDQILTDARDAREQLENSIRGATAAHSALNRGVEGSSPSGSTLTCNDCMNFIELCTCK